MLAAYFTGIYQMYIMSERIPDTQTSREQVQEYNGPKPPGCPGERCWLLRTAGLLFDGGPADTGFVLSHWVTFLFAMYFPLPTSPLGKKQSPFPPSSIICDWRDGLRLWASLSHRGAGRCHLLTPGLPATQNDPVRGQRRPERRTCCTQSLVLIVKALWQRAKLRVSTARFAFLAFQPAENFYVKYAALRPPRYLLRSCSTESG